MAPWVGDSSYTINPQQSTPWHEREAARALAGVAVDRPEGRAELRVALDVLGLIPREATPEPASEPPVVPLQRVKPRRVRPGRRWCSMHGASHPVAAFGRDANNADGLASSCREARCAAQRRRRLGEARRAER